MLVWTLPATPAVAAVAATLVLALGTRAFPPVAPAPVPTGDSTAAAPVRRTPPALELCARMLAGALLVLAVTGAATLLGTAWSGMLAVYPVVGSVLAVFSHQTQGPVYTAALLRAMTAALPSLALFCLVVAVVLPRAGIGASFVAAIVGALAAHAVVRRIALPRMADATLPRQRR